LQPLEIYGTFLNKPFINVIPNDRLRRMISEAPPTSMKRKRGREEDEEDDDESGPSSPRPASIPSVPKKKKKTEEEEEDKKKKKEPKEPKRMSKKSNKKKPTSKSTTPQDRLRSEAHSKKMTKTTRATRTSSRGPKIPLAHNTTPNDSRQPTPGPTVLPPAAAPIASAASEHTAAVGDAKVHWPASVKNDIKTRMELILVELDSTQYFHATGDLKIALERCRDAMGQVRA